VENHSGNQSPPPGVTQNDQTDSALIGAVSAPTVLALALFDGLCS
jgi:hypothetical protein